MSNVLQLTNMQKDHWLQIVLSYYTTHPDQRRQCCHPATRVHCYNQSTHPGICYTVSMHPITSPHIASHSHTQAITVSLLIILLMQVLLLVSTLPVHYVTFQCHILSSPQCPRLPLVPSAPTDSLAPGCQAAVSGCPSSAAARQLQSTVSTFDLGRDS